MRNAWPTGVTCDVSAAAGATVARGGGRRSHGGRRDSPRSGGAVSPCPVLPLPCPGDLLVGVGADGARLEQRQPFGQEFFEISERTTLTQPVPVRADGYDVLGLGDDAVGAHGRDPADRALPGSGQLRLVREDDGEAVVFEAVEPSWRRGGRATSRSFSTLFEPRPEVRTVVLRMVVLLPGDSRRRRRPRFPYLLPT